MCRGNNQEISLFCYGESISNANRFSLRTNVYDIQVSQKSFLFPKIFEYVYDIQMSQKSFLFPKIFDYVWIERIVAILLTILLM